MVHVVWQHAKEELCAVFTLNQTSARVDVYEDANVGGSQTVYVLKIKPGMTCPAELRPE